MSLISRAFMTAAQHQNFDTARGRDNLTEWEREFVFDIGRKARPLTDRQAAILARIAEGSVDIAAVKRAALARLREVVQRLLPGGKELRGYWVCANLQGGQGESCRVCLTGQRAGAWGDFATSEVGGDPVSLAAAVANITQLEAAKHLAKMLGMDGGHG